MGPFFISEKTGFREGKERKTITRQLINQFAIYRPASVRCPAPEHDCKWLGILRWLLNKMLTSGDRTRTEGETTGYEETRDRKRACEIERVPIRKQLRKAHIITEMRRQTFAHLWHGNANEIVITRAARSSMFREFVGKVRETVAD
uniref:Uncharacterized protein n=1 Tax=Pristionchus pacificus TaxID=54126 RepID=A0A8R1UST8_PRIPA